MGLYKKILQLTRKFFFRFHQLAAVQSFGIFLYKTGLFLFIKILKRNISNIESIYTMTQFDTGFVVGASDIDLWVVVSDIDTGGEIEFVSRLARLESKLNYWFPFIYFSCFFSSDFDVWRTSRYCFIQKAGKHFSDARLIHGQSRSLPSSDCQYRVSGYDLRVFYDQAIVNICFMQSIGQNYYRLAYKFFLDIIRAYFILENNREAADNSEYQSFLKERGIDSIFIDQFFALPANNFKTDLDELILYWYWIIKILEKVQRHHSFAKTDNKHFEVVGTGRDFTYMADIDDFNNALDKTHIQSIQLNQYLFLDQSYFMYILLENNLTFDEFGVQIKNILSNYKHLSSFWDKLFIEDRLAMQGAIPAVLPTVITDDMSGFHQFINASCAETANWQHNGQTLFGQSSERDLVVGDIENSFYTGDGQYNILYLYVASSLQLKRLMFIRLLKEKNIMCMGDIYYHYTKHFGDTKYDLGSQADQYLFVRELIGLIH
jgi:hypothetical protein